MFAGGVRPGDRVLDVGTGPGALTLAAANRGAHVLGIDASPEMVARVSARLREAGCGGCEARVMDGQSLNIPDGSFDTAFSVFGVVVFPDWRRGMSELARVLRPGGRGCVVVFTRAEGAAPVRLLYDAFRHRFPETAPLSVSPAFATLMHVDELKKEMAEAGFSDIAIHTVSGTFHPQSADWLMDSMDRLYGVLPFYKALHESGREGLRESMRSVLLQYETPDGLRVPSDAHIAVGRR